MSKALLELVLKEFAGDVVSSHSDTGDDTAVIRPEAVLRVARFLFENPAASCKYLVDLTAVDYFKRREPRFEVVYHFMSFEHRHRLRIKAGVGEPNPELESVTPIYPGADWYEREVWDMYGIKFTGHPNLRRILLYEEFKGHPLRKDYPINKRQPLVGPIN